MVFPVFVTGHHCGAGALRAALAGALVFPVFVTGHHCGHRIVEVADSLVERLPGLRDRASLRR